MMSVILDENDIDNQEEEKGGIIEEIDNGTRQVLRQPGTNQITDSKQSTTAPPIGRLGSIIVNGCYGIIIQEESSIISITSYSIKATEENRYRSGRLDISNFFSSTL